MERQYIILSKGTRESCQREPSRQLAEGGERRALGRDGNRAQGTPEQNKAVVQGSIAFYGTYIQETDSSPRMERRLPENNVPPLPNAFERCRRPVGNEGQ